MSVIHKYPLKLDDVQTVSMPGDADILSVQIQNGQICLWAVVNKSNPPEDRIIEVFGTGFEFEDNEICRTHLGTVQQGIFVWHVFERWSCGVSNNA